MGLLRYLERESVNLIEKSDFSRDYIMGLFGNPMKDVSLMMLVILNVFLGVLVTVLTVVGLKSETIQSGYILSYVFGVLLVVSLLYFILFLIEKKLLRFVLVFFPSCLLAASLIYFDKLNVPIMCISSVICIVVLSFTHEETFRNTHSCALPVFPLFGLQYTMAYMIVIYSPRSEQLENEIEEYHSVISGENKKVVKPELFDVFEVAKSQISESLYKFAVSRSKTEEGTNDLVMFMAAFLPDHFSLDAKKQILLPLINSTRSIVFDKKYKELLESKDQKDKFWGSSTENQVKAILSHPYKISDLWESISVYVEKGQLPNTNGKVFSDFFLSEEKTLLNKNLPQIENIADGPYSFKVFRYKTDFNKGKTDFKNCVLSHFNNKESDVFALYKDNSPMACVSLNKSMKITEIKAPFNRECSKEIKDYVNQALKQLT